MMEARMTGLRMVGVVGRLMLCIAALGMLAAVYPESTSTKVPESYPAAGLVELDAGAAGVRQIDSTFSQLRHVRDWSHPEIEVMDGGQIVPQAPRIWRQVESHPYISQVLPGVEFYSVVGAQGWRGGYMGAANLEWMMARWQGQLYKMPEDFKQLLYDHGMRFYKADAPTWARLLALVWAMVYRDYLYGQVVGVWDFKDDTYWRLPAVPPVAFESVEVETTRVRAYMNGRLRLVLNGTSVELRLEAGESEFGKTESTRFGVEPLEIERSPSGPRMQVGPIKERSSLDGQIQLDIPKGSGIYYHSYTSIGHPPVDSGVYCVVEDQGAPTNPVVRFDVSGMQGDHDSIYVALKNRYAHDALETLKVQITAGSGTAGDFGDAVLNCPSPNYVHVKTRSDS
jgi:hypothetical protein